MISTNTYLEIVISIIATLIVLAILVQTLQECYKYLTSLKARAFICFLRDIYGIGKDELIANVNKNLTITSPFQLREKIKRTKILPLGKDLLNSAFERNLPKKNEIPPALDKEKNETPPTPYKEKKVIFPIQDMEWDQLVKNFDYTYSRRNLRITFIIALIVTFFFNLPIQNIYEKQGSLTTSQLADLTEKLGSINNNLKHLSEEGTKSKDSISVEEIDESSVTMNNDSSNIEVEYDSLITKINELVSNKEYKAQLVKFVKITEFESLAKFMLYFFGCIITSILICFGAPFWNEILGALTSMKKKNK